MKKILNDLQLAKIEERGKWTGWDRSEGTKLILELVSGIRGLKKTIHQLSAKSFIESMNRKLDDHECVVVEIPTLEQMIGDQSMTIDDFVDDVSKRAHWKAILNQKNNTIMFYKNVHGGGT